MEGENLIAGHPENAFGKSGRTVGTGFLNPWQIINDNPSFVPTAENLSACPSPNVRTAVWSSRRPCGRTISGPEDFVIRANLSSSLSRLMWACIFFPFYLIPNPLVYP
jgi:hypothetical protein